MSVNSITRPFEVTGELLVEANQTSTIKITTCLLSYLAGYLASRFFDEGLSKVLALQTLRHGTNPLNYIKIRLFGGDPKQGGKNWKDYDPDTVGYFFVVQDETFLAKNKHLFPENILGSLVKRFLPKMYIYFSGMLLTTKVSRPDFQGTFLQHTLARIGGITSLLITPTLHFRFAEIDPERFEEEPKKSDKEPHQPGAYRTKQVIEPWRIGFLGSLLTGLNTNLISRMGKKIEKVRTGTIQIACAVTIIFLARRYIPLEKPYIISATIGALLT